MGRAQKLREVGAHTSSSWRIKTQIDSISSANGLFHESILRQSSYFRALEEVGWGAASSRGGLVGGRNPDTHPSAADVDQKGGRTLPKRKSGAFASLRPLSSF